MRQLRSQAKLMPLALSILSNVSDIPPRHVNCAEWPFEAERCRVVSGTLNGKGFTDHAGQRQPAHSLLRARR